MLGTMTLEDAAKAAAGNWRKFNSFVWWREREMNDVDQWAIIYTSNRDSGLLDQSNSAVIARTMEQFTKGRSPSDEWHCRRPNSCQSLPLPERSRSRSTWRGSCMRG